MSFTLYTPQNAPEAAQTELASSLKSFGFVPNLHAVLAEAPAALKAYKSLHGLFTETSFDAEELTVVWQSINVETTATIVFPPILVSPI